MEVILLEEVANLGDLGDLVKVRQGYGRNYLIPTGKAVPATADNKARFEARRAELEQAATERLDRARQRCEVLGGQTVVISARAGEGGKLFGSVGTADIAAAMTAAGNDVEKSEIRMPTGPIRETGSYEINISLHPDVTATITVNVEAEA